MTKIYHKAQPPHEVSTPFHCSHQMILPSLYTCKNPPNYHKKNQNISLKVKPLFSGRHVKTSPFSIFPLCRYSWPKAPLKLEKWLSLLVDFGQVPPWAVIPTPWSRLGLLHLPRFVQHSYVNWTEKFLVHVKHLQICQL